MGQQNMTELRKWQAEALPAVLTQFDRVRSTMVVACTGSGKTRLGIEVAAQLKTRCLWLAPRYELLTQARSAIQRETELTVGMEQADNLGGMEDVIVASVATIHKDKRLHRYKPDEFGLLVIDEAHFSVSRTYRKIIEFFTGAKCLFLTATPDRLDKVGLGVLVDSVAHVYDIVDAIRDGVLCRVRAEHVRVDAINLKDVGTSMGDLAQGQLDAVLRSREAIHGIVKPVLEKAGNRPTLVFTSSVETANAMVDVFNAYLPGCAAAAFGETDLDVRAKLTEQHRDGKFQFFISVGIHTYGVDLPWVSCIALARPSKSRVYVAQSIGRGLRSAPGKDDLLVLDFCGITGKHKLVTPLDILGGKFSEAALVSAKRKALPGQDVLELLDSEERAEKEHLKAEKERQAEAEKKRIAQFRADVTYGITTADLFGQLGQKPPSYLDNLRTRPSPGQVTMLRKFGIPIPEDLTSQSAQAILRREFARSSKGLARYKQIQLLARYGVSAENITCKDASARIDSIARNGWQRTT